MVRLVPSLSFIMNDRNYQKEMEKMILGWDGDHVPRLLLHSCCAPCSSYVLAYLSEYFEITVYYYNPNIFPKEEYEYRASEQKRLTEVMETRHPIYFQKAEYSPEEFYEAVSGLEREPEGGARCTKCFELRLQHAAKVALEGAFDFFTTTLSISPLKDSERLNSIGESLSKTYGVPYLVSDFKKKNGYLRSCELSKEYGLYRQDFCGCVYSKEEREKQKKEGSGDGNQRI